MFWTKSKQKQFHWQDNKPKQWTSDDLAKQYHTTRWRKLRKRFISQFPLCAECLTFDKVVEAKVVDHIKPIKDGGEMYDWDNLQSLCHSCHNSKSARERKR